MNPERNYLENTMWRLADRNGNAIIDENANTISYTALHEETQKLAEMVQTADHRYLVFCYCSNTAGSLMGYAAFINHRIVPLMLEIPHNGKLQNELMDTYMPDYLWLPQNTCEGLERGFKKIYTSRGYALVKTSYRRSFELNGQLALLLATSGSTGSPKLVRQSYQNLKANTESIINYLGINTEDRAITTLPMNYTYGLSIINTHLYTGAAIVLTSKSPVQKDFWDLLTTTKATNFGGVPYTYEILNKLGFLDMSLPSLRYCTQAGGKLKKDLNLKYAKESRKKGRDFIVMYGASEATARMSYVPREMAVEKAGSIGIPIPGGRFELIDQDKSLITESGVPGELVYYGANVSMGYAERCSDLEKGDEWNGRLETGDIAERDSDGFYYIVGRKSRFLKLFGKRVNLLHIEEFLDQRGYSAACAGNDDQMRVFTTSEDTAAVRDIIFSLTGINRAAFEVIHVSKLPRNDAGKVLYSEI